MLRALCMMLCASSFAFAQTSNQTQAGGSAASSAVQVVYVAAGSTLTTYNVDPDTLQATQAGTTAIAESNTAQMVTLRGGRFLYYFADQGTGNTGNELFVYDTNTLGVPGNEPVQKLNATHLFGMVPYPKGTFLYTVSVGSLSGETARYSIVRNLVDASFGTISQPVTEATYRLSNVQSGSNCYLQVLGFNNGGTAMYDAVFCNAPHATDSATYYMRSVDPQTGALGPDQEVTSWGFYGGSGAEYVQFVNDLMFEFINTEFDGVSVEVFRAEPNASRPLIDCTSSMWSLCGSFEFGQAHPSGKYVFLVDSSYNTDIGAVDLSTKQIGPTSSIQYLIQQFSPNGTLAYSQDDGTNTSAIQINGFNVSSGQAMQGGTISLPSNYQLWLVGQRD